MLAATHHRADSFEQATRESAQGQLIPFGVVVILKPSPTKLAPHKPLLVGAFGSFSVVDSRLAGVER